MAGVVMVAPATAQTSLYDLQTEALDNPIGLDSSRPRFSWKMKDERPGAHQTAYQVQVAVTTESLKAGEKLLWDSGRQETSASINIEYAGPDLKPRTGYVWHVKAWDMEGRETPFSEPAYWETGLMSRDEWSASWISGSYNEQAVHLDFTKANWIWYPGGDASETAEPGFRYFQHEFELPEKPVQSAQAWILSDDLGVAYINGKQFTNTGGFQGISTEDVTSLIKPGKNIVQGEVENAGNNPAGFAFSTTIHFKDGTSHTVSTNSEWRSAKIPGTGWPNEKTTTTENAEWVGVQDMGAVGRKPWGEPNIASEGPPASMFRKEFDAASEPARARLYITALGSYRAEINGQRVGNAVLTPEWTDYLDRVMYQAYDVTDLIKSGDNAIGVLLGDGWYASALGWQLKRLNFGPAPTRFLAELHIDYADGRSDVVVTDSSWKTAEAPIQRSELYYGEIYDARKEQAGWSSPGFDATAWRAVDRPETSSSIEISHQSMPPIRITKQVEPVEITEPEPGVFVYDMGQNMVGWVKLKVSGKAGDTVRLRFAEVLNDDGTIYRENLRRAEATDTYILRGDGEEVFEPHFTYHGFRYVEITGYPGGKPAKDAIIGQVFHTDLPVTGTFESSDSMVNQIVKNTTWGLWGNLMSVPTDCPQRDERLGWLGDAQCIWNTACYLMDMRSFTDKWMRDLRDAQGEQGDFPNVAPRVVVDSPGAPAWGDAGVIIPHNTWLIYGDTRLITDMWDSMEAWMSYLLEGNPNYLWLERRSNDFGDWVPANSTTDKDMIATAYWARNANLMADMAKAVGLNDREAYYRDLYGKIRKAFQDRFIAEDGKIANGSQTCYVLALDWGLVPDELKEAALNHLLADIKERGNHLSTGFLGSTHLLPVLSDFNQNDMAVTLLLNKTFPSWGYMIEQGATTIWERWNSDTGDPSMNSFNHFNYGAVVEWLYGYLGGIRPGGPGFKEALLKPMPDPRINSVSVSYDTQYGKISSSWKYASPEGGELTWDVEIPANTTARISLPTADASKVKLGGKALPAEMNAKNVDGRVEVSAKAGKLSFVIAP